MKINVTCNQLAAIKSGVDPVEKYELDIDLGTLTPDQRVVVAEIASGHGLGISIIRPDVVEWVAAVQAVVDARKADEEHKKAKKTKAENEYRSALLTLGLTMCSIRATEIDGKWVMRSDDVYDAVVVSREGREALMPSPWCIEKPAAIQAEPAIAAHLADLRAQADAHNAAEFARALPIFLAKREADKVAAEEKERRESAARSAKYARRIETGIVKIALSRDDRSEWGEPWIAKVISRNGRKPEYDFSAGSYDTSSETLSIPCKPGEVIAYGQKNYRKANKTIHNVRKMTDDGRLVSA